jgi:hypothetical protein
MIATDIWLALIFFAVLVDTWITRKWLKEARRVLIEIEKQTRNGF